MDPFIFEPSWILLTHNRPEVTERCLAHNIENAGIYEKEIIWIDNDSKCPNNRWQYVFSQCDIAVINLENKGVARGYNQGYVLATGSHVVITGCDRLMPDGWLSTFKECFQHIPNTGIISVYSKTEEQVPERFIKDNLMVNRNVLGLVDCKLSSVQIHECIPFESRILSRELFNKIGYLREDFGLYGYEDIEWSNRAQRVTKELGLINYTIPGMLATHLGTEGVAEYDGVDDRSYHEFKKRELADPQKLEVFNRCVKENFPYYNPFI